MNKSNEEIREELRRQTEEESRRLREGLEVMKEGKGRLGLEKPIASGEGEITELCYDFKALTGLDYTDAMDSGGGGRTVSGLSHRQALALFAKAAAGQHPELDMQDIVTRIGASDAAEAVELANFFFTASLLAGRKRISRR